MAPGDALLYDSRSGAVALLSQHELESPTLALAGCYTALRQTDGMIVTKLHSKTANKITKLEGEVPDSIANCAND